MINNKAAIYLNWPNQKLAQLPSKHNYQKLYLINYKYLRQSVLIFIVDAAFQFKQIILILFSIELKRVTHQRNSAI